MVGGWTKERREVWGSVWMRKRKGECGGVGGREKEFGEVSVYM